MGEGTLESFGPGLQWHNGEPAEWSVTGKGEVVVKPTPQLDYWSRTFYEPCLRKHDGQTLLTTVQADEEVTLTTCFTLEPRAQFDQAGVMIRVDDNCWVKAGIEFCDGVPRLSCVVTNDGFSDWSTQPWAFDDASGAGDDDAPPQVTLRLRVTKTCLLYTSPSPRDS